MRALVSLGILAVGAPIAARFIPQQTSNILQIVAWQIADLKVVYHLSLHLLAFILGSFLLVISAKAFLRDGRSRVLILSVAFGLIAVREAVNIADLALFGGRQVLPFTDIEVAHLIDFLIIALFSAGTLKS